MIFEGYVTHVEHHSQIKSCNKSLPSLSSKIQSSIINSVSVAEIILGYYLTGHKVGVT